MSDFFNDNDLNELNELAGEISNPASYRLAMNDYTFIGAKKKVTPNGTELFEFTFRSDGGVFAPISVFKGKDGKYNFTFIDRVLSFMASCAKVEERDRIKLIKALTGKRIALKFKEISKDGKVYEQFDSMQRASDDMPF